MKKLFLSLGVLMASMSALADNTTSPYTGSTVGAGTYYLYNVESGLWLQNNDSKTHDWHTRGNVGTRGIDFTLSLSASGDGYLLNSKFNNGQSVNAGNNYLDTGVSDVWVFTPVTKAGVTNAYTIANGEHVMGTVCYNEAWKANNLFTQTADNRWYLENDPHNKNMTERNTWQLVSRQERIDYMVAQASAENPQPASWLIPGADFANNDTRYNQWNRVEFGRGCDADTDTRRGNMMMDKVSGTPAACMTITLTNIPNGLYRFNLQGYYRDGGLGDVAGRRTNKQEVIRACYFANDVRHTLMSILDEPLTAAKIDNQFCNESNGYWMPNLGGEASEAINRSKAFVNPEIEVIVTDGTLTLGIQKTGPDNGGDWTVFDNFHLTFLGQAAAEAKMAATDQSKAKLYLIDFGAYNSRNGQETIGADQNGNLWNNVHPTATADGAKITAGTTFALTNALGQSKGYQIEISTEFETNGIYNGGQLEAPATLGNLGVTTATHDYMFVNSSVASSTVNFSGLNPNQGYRFTVYGSRTDSGQRTGKFTFTGFNTWSADYNTASSNGNATLVSDVVFPQADGTITLTITDHAGFVHVNAMMIEETGWLISESLNNVLTPAADVTVTLARQLSADYWNTFCVPFAMTAAQVAEAFGSDTKITTFKEVDSEGVMHFEDATAIEAGMPCLIKPATTTPATITLSGVTMTDTEAQSVGNGSYKFTGTYSPVELKTDGSNLFLQTSGKLASPAETTKTMKGMRAYFQVPAGAAARIVFDDGTTTGIDLAAPSTRTAESIYTLGGRKAGNAKGIAISKGKKYIRK